MTKNITNAHSIRVSPGIGMARVGNSDEYFIGPETPGVIPQPPNGTYKDTKGNLKPQAQRFRAFAYDANGVLIDEVNNGDTVNGTTITLNWQVHVTNMKAANYAFQGKYGFNSAQLRNSTIQADKPPAERDRLIIDPGVKSISGNNAAEVELLDQQGSGSVIFDVADLAPAGGFTLPAAVQFDPPQSSNDPTAQIPVTYQGATVSLGRLLTDDVGRLIFIGGKGQSESCTTPSVVISKIPTEDNDLKDNPEYNGNSYFNNPGWYDDTCGGSINVELLDNNGNSVMSTNDQASQRGWIGVAPPNYSPATDNVVSLLDLQLDLHPEIDPYTGIGPLVLAVNNVDQGISLARSFNGVNYGYQNIGGTFKTTQQPTIALLAGLPFIAAVGSDGQVYIGNSITNELSPIQSSIKTALAPSLTVFNNQLYLAIIGTDGQPYLATSSDGKADSFTFESINDNLAIPLPTSNFAPAVAPYNGSLYYAYISDSNEILLSVRNNTTQTFNTHVIGQANQANSGPSLAFFRGKLALAYNDEAMIMLGTSEVNFDADTNETSSFTFNLVSPVYAGGDSNFTPALSYFNNKLYLTNVNEAQQTIVGSSTDARTFTFNNTNISTLSSAGITTFQDVNFFRDLYPILHTVTDYAWTNERAFHGHRPGSQGDFLRDEYLNLLADPNLGQATEYSKQPSADARVFVFRYIRPPAEVPSEPVPPPPMTVTNPPTTTETQRIDLMPRLFGNGGSPTENEVNETAFPNQWLSLTNNQLAKFQQWVNGNFDPGTQGQQRWQDIPVPEQLSFAALQPTVGGGFHPGIELTYLMHEPVFFDGPFRFAQNIIPGSIAAYMSVPWQGDFWSCNISWWPAIRPDIVVQRNDASPPVLNAIPWFRSAEIPPYADTIDLYNGGYQSMAHNWSKFGIVTPVVDANGNKVMDQGEQVYSEVERDASLDVASVINTITENNTNNGLNLATDGTTVSAQPPAQSTTEQWQLVPYSGSPDYFMIESKVNNQVLSINNDQLVLEDVSVPHNDAQLWQYLPSGYPDTCYLVAKFNGLVLTNSNGAINLQKQGAALATNSTQKWKLSSSV